MPRVTFYPANRTIETAAGTTILQTARAAGIVIEAPCNGVGTCGKCKVKLDSKSLENIESSGEQQLSAQQAGEGIVLACSARIVGDISVELIDNEQQNSTLKVLSFGKSFAIELAPFITKCYSTAENLTRVFAGEALIGTEKGDTIGSSFGLVVDIGTTTLVTSLLDLNSGEEISSASALNPQSLHAQDVLSRIQFASEEPGLEIMYSVFIKELNRMIHEITTSSAISKNNIYEVVFSGNTCMLHLATKVNPRSLGRFPYTPELTGGVHIEASRLGLDIAGCGLIYLPPIISAYVGADITSGILATKLPKRPGVTLLVDIGTNGEMVMCAGGKLAATSTAAGPAFEGMNITHGMRAGNGAIEVVNVEEEGSLTVKTIGEYTPIGECEPIRECEPIGICGSGLLDLVGELVAHGVIDRSGRYTDPVGTGVLTALREKLVRQEGKTIFRVSEKVYLTQKDIRQVQLAKGAVRAGIEYLLKSQGITADEVDTVLIAGSFGYHLRAKSLVNIGLIPEEFAEKIDFVGNTSKTGGQAFLLNRNYREEMLAVVKRISILDLASYEDFERVFVSCLAF